MSAPSPSPSSRGGTNTGGTAVPLAAAVATGTRVVGGALTSTLAFVATGGTGVAELFVGNGPWLVAAGVATAGVVGAGGPLGWGEGGGRGGSDTLREDVAVANMLDVRLPLIVAVVCVAVRVCVAGNRRCGSRSSGAHDSSLGPCASASAVHTHVQLP